MRKQILILAILANGLGPAVLAAVDNVRMLGVTHAQAVLGYTAPSMAACTVEVSKQSSLTPLAHDVNPALFSGAGNDGGGSRARVFQIGKMTVDTASDGKNYSRSLQTATVHYFRVSCGADTAIGTFETGNIPLGMTYVPNQEIDGVTGNWLQPTVSYTDRTQEVIDPVTGTLLKRFVMPRDAIYEYDFANATGGSGAAWTTPTNVSGAPNGAFASYGGTAQDKLVINLSTTFQYVGLGFDFITLRLTGAGSGATTQLRTIQVCLSVDSTTCAGSVVDIVLPASNGLVYYNQANNLQDMMGATLDPFHVRLYTSAQLLVWKKATSGSDTVSIDSVASYWGESIRGNATAGGFHDICGIRDSNGWFKCVVSGQLYAINSATGESRNMGTFGIFYSAHPPLVGGFDDCFTFGGGSRTFSQTNANQFYCGFRRWDLDATNTARAGGVDQYMVASNPVLLLPASGTPSLEVLLHQFDPTLPPNWLCQADAVQGNYIIGACRAGQQDSYAYTWVFSLGNGTSMDDASCGTITNGKCSSSGVGIVAVNAVWRSPVSRYTTFHTIHSQGPVNIIGYETQFARGTHQWGNNPVATTLTNNLNSTQTNVTVNSAWVSSAVLKPGTLTSSGFGVSFSGIGYSVEYATTVGDQICAAGQCRTVTYIYSTTGVNINTPFSPELTSAAWTNQWPAAPGDYVAGEPVSYKMPHYLGPTIVGDSFMIDGEAVRIVTKHSPTSWTVARGCSYFEAVCSGVGTSHAAGAAMTPQGIGGSFGEGLQYYWDFVADPYATDSNAGDPANTGQHSVAGIRAPNGYSGSHQTTRGKCLVAAGYDVTCVENGIADKSAWGKPSNYPLSVATGWGFNSRYAQNAGNTYQRHPSNHQMSYCSLYGLSEPDCNFFTDYTPFVGGTAWVAPATPSTSVEGNVWKLGLPDGNGNVLTASDIKSMPIVAVNGQKALKDISGPASHITTSATRYEYCFALKAGECRGAGDAGGASSAGDIFFNAPGLTVGYCSGGENYEGTNDICIGNQTADGNATVQFGMVIPASSSTVVSERGKRLRTLGKVFAQPRYGSSNAKVLPDGSWIFHPGVHDGSADMWLLKNPGMPPLDSINRQTFQQVRLRLRPPPSLVVDNAYVEFGYDNNLYCTGRAESCVAAANNNPYFFAGEPFSGVPCASGCTIDVPSIPSRVLRYRFVYRDASNMVLRRSDIYSIATP